MEGDAKVEKKENINEIDLSKAENQLKYLKHFANEVIKTKNSNSIKESICEMIRNVSVVLNATDLDQISAVCTVKKNDNKKKGKKKQPSLKLETKKETYDTYDDYDDAYDDQYDFM